MTEMIHDFEKAGFGKAPFRFIGVREKWFKAAPEAPKVPGSSCDYCGMGIAYEYHIQSNDGKKFKVGSDCVNKTGDAGLKRIIDKKVRELKRVAKREKDLAKIAQAQEILCDKIAILREKPHPIIEEKTLLDYVEWMMINAGISGKVRVANIIIKA